MSQPAAHAGGQHRGVLAGTVLGQRGRAVAGPEPGRALGRGRAAGRGCSAGRRRSGRRRAGSGVRRPGGRTGRCGWPGPARAARPARRGCGSRPARSMRDGLQRLVRRAGEDRAGDVAGARPGLRPDASSTTSAPWCTDSTKPLRMTRASGTTWCTASGQHQVTLYRRLVLTVASECCSVTAPALLSRPAQRPVASGGRRRGVRRLGGGLAGRRARGLGGLLGGRGPGARPS